MAFVRVEQRNAHLAGAVRLEMDNGPEGKVAKGTLTAFGNIRSGLGEEREDEATAIQWTPAAAAFRNAGPEGRVGRLGLRRRWQKFGLSNLAVAPLTGGANAQLPKAQALDLRRRRAAPATATTPTSIVANELGSGTLVAKASTDPTTSCPSVISELA